MSSTSIQGNTIATSCNHRRATGATRSVGTSTWKQWWVCCWVTVRIPHKKVRIKWQATILWWKYSKEHCQLSNLQSVSRWSLWKTRQPTGSKFASYEALEYVFIVPWLKLHLSVPSPHSYKHSAVFSSSCMKTSLHRRCFHLHSCHGILDNCDPFGQWSPEESGSFQHCRCQWPQSNKLLLFCLRHGTVATKPY